MEFSLSADLLKDMNVTGTYAYTNMAGSATEHKISFLTQVAKAIAPMGLHERALGCLQTAARLGDLSSPDSEMMTTFANLVEAKHPLTEVLGAHCGIVMRKDEGDEFHSLDRAFSNSDDEFSNFMGLCHSSPPANTADLSFIITYKGQPSLRVLCAAEGDRGIGPVRFERTTETKDGMPKTLGSAIALLRLLAQRAGVPYLLILDAGQLGTMSDIGRSLYLSGAIPELHHYIRIDLQNDPTMLWQDVRKSYRSLIRSQQNVLDIRHTQGGNLDDALVRDYWALYKDTEHMLQQEDAENLLAQVGKGLGELTVGYLGNQPVSATIVLENYEIAYYTAGHFKDTPEFGKMGHSLVWAAITRMHEKKRKKIFLSDLIRPSLSVKNNHEVGYVGKKIMDINHFKMGFSSGVDQVLLWRILL